MSRRNQGWLLILPLLAAGAVALVGCGSSSGGGKLSRADYIGLLGSVFGYESYEAEESFFSDVSPDTENFAEIQASVEWDVLDGGGEFKPDNGATLGFSLESAVRAVGIENITASGVTFDESDLISFYTGSIAGVDVSDKDAPVDAETAEQILNYAKDYRNQLERPQTVEIEFADGVRTADEGMLLSPNEDVVNVLFGNTSDYAVGDILYFENTSDGFPRAMRITAVGDKTFDVEPASNDDTYSYVNVSGTFAGAVLNATSASDGTDVTFGDDLYNEMHAYGMKASEKEYETLLLANGVQAGIDKGKDHVTFNASFNADNKESDSKVSLSSSGSFKIGIENVKFDVDFEKEWFDVKKAGLKVRFDTVVHSHIEGHAACTIPLGDAYFQIGTSPLVVRLALTANLGADGNVDVDYTTVNVLDTGWKKGAGFYKTFNSTPSASMEADVTLTAEATALLDLRLGYGKVSESVVNAQITSGVVGIAKLDADLLGNQPTCVDVLIYVPLRWGVNQEGCILTWINKNFQYTGTIWDASNSPVQLHFHFEDGARTPGDVCTRKEEVKQEQPEEEAGKPIEYELFEFEKLEFDFIELERYGVFIDKGGSEKVPLLSVPEGYSESELLYKVDDPSICSVSGGTITAGESGSTIVKISTPDDMFTVSLAVTVSYDYSVDFIPLPET